MITFIGVRFAIQSRVFKVEQNSNMRANGTRALKILMLCMLVMVSGCSLIRVAYNNGESLSYLWLDGYVDIESDQRPWVNERIGRVFEWHRKTQMKDYVVLLKQAQRQLQSPIDKPIMLANLADVRKRALVALDHTLPDMADLALDLRPQQLAAITKKFASNNKDYRKSHLRGDLKERQRKRYEKILSQAEYWFGDFNREQEARIRTAANAVPIDNELFNRSRLSRQNELVRLLEKIQKERPSREVTIALLRDYTVPLVMQSGGAEYGDYFNSYRDGMMNVALEVVNITTPAQKAHAAEKLQQLINDFSEIAG
jgi:lysyl-tRNA synthetase class I